MLTTINEVVDYLRMRQLPLSLGEAIGVLRDVAQQDRFLALYRHFFPKEFAASRASVQRALGLAYSEREIEFFDLVNEHLFPIPALTDFVLMEWDTEERSPYIPITPWGREWWDEYDLAPGWQVLLFLSGEFSCTDPPHYSLTLAGHPDWPQLLPLFKQAAVLPREPMEQAAQEGSAPLCHLPLALRMVQHDTDNFWIDSTPEMVADDVPWCIENMELLAKECRQAEEIMDRVTSLVSWLEEDLIEHLRKAVALWQASPVQG